MIEFKTGDLLGEQAEALVNTVNCEGFMGRGIALQFKRAWPDNFKAYAAACRRHEVRPGHMFVFATGQLGNPRFIINFPTKRQWRNKARLEDIDSGLEALVKEINERGIQSIAVPPLGAGLGGLDWAVVRPRIEHALGGLVDLNVVVFEPTGKPEPGTSRAPKTTPAMTPGRAALIGLVERYMAGLLDPFVSLLELHKLMYFMQEAGEPLKLRLTKAAYGPYAENLRHVLGEIEGAYIKGYGAGGDDPLKTVELLPGAVEKAREVLESQPATRERFDKVASLVEGFESAFGLELLATVHWVAQREGAKSEPAVLEKTYAWNERKRRFAEPQIRIARKQLVQHGWLTD